MAGYAQLPTAVVDLREALLNADRVVVLTGAGISAESGVPTFRGPGGLWRNYSPEELATPEAFARNPKLVWEWYDWRRGLIRSAQPSRGHHALAQLEWRQLGIRAPERAEGRLVSVPVEPDDSRNSREFTLITQNVDGLHERAGSRNVVKLHGDIWRVQCTGCGTTTRNEQVPLESVPPRCSCGALLRPGVVWFGESLPRPEWDRAVSANVRAQLVLIVGTSGIVYPAAGLAELAGNAGARLAAINPQPTPLDALAQWVLHGTSGEILPELI
jgi:NAD-dependent protein deacetylase/lipoamidase